MKNRGHNVLFVCPTRKLVQLYKGATPNQFFSFGINPNSKMPKFDDSSYNVIVFDEIYFYDIPMMARIKKYCLANPDKIIIATGDTCQLNPINPLTNQFKHAEYADNCINQIFQYEIYLEENKRLKLDSDKQKLKNVKTELFNNDIPAETTIRKHFKFTTTVTQSRKI